MTTTTTKKLKPKNCVKGKQCGSTCITLTKECRPAGKRSKGSKSVKAKKTPLKLNKGATDLEGLKTLGADFVNSRYKPTRASKKEKDAIARKHELVKELKQPDTGLIKKRKLIKEAEVLDKEVARLMRLRLARDFRKLENLKKDIIRQNGISKADADKWAGSLPFTGDNPNMKALASNPVRVQKIRDSYSELDQLTGGKARDSLKELTYENPRAHASKLKGTINVGLEGSNGDKGVLFHEGGHHVEYRKTSLAEASRDFIESRALYGKQISTLRDITRDSAYGTQEVAMVDKWYHPYVGKIYGGRGSPTEVVSMGIEKFINPREMKSLYDQDREHFNFTVGLMLADK